MPDSNTFHNALFRMAVWFNQDSKQFHGQSPDVLGWASVASTVHQLHQELLSVIQVRHARLDIQFVDQQSAAC